MNQPINNPMQFMQAIRGGQNPQQLMLQMLQQRMGNTPMGQNLMQLAQNNDTAGIEQIARNLCAQRGLDFDQEFSSFKQRLGLTYGTYGYNAMFGGPLNNGFGPGPF